MQQHRSALHAECGAAQPACPQTGAGGVVAAGAYFQQHGRKGCKRRGQQQPAACRQQAKIQHKAAQFQVGHRCLRKDSVERRRRFSLRSSGRRGQRLRYAANTAEQRRRQPACQYLCGKQTHPRRTAAQQLLPNRQDDKGWPGADAGGQQSRSLLRGQFPAADCLGSGNGSRGKAANKADEQHTARAAAA